MRNLLKITRNNYWPKIPFGDEWPRTGEEWPRLFVLGVAEIGGGKHKESVAQDVKHYLETR